MLQLPEAKRLEEVGKTDNLNYCLYHRIIRHSIRNFYIRKDKIHALVDTNMIKLQRTKEDICQYIHHKIWRVGNPCYRWSCSLFEGRNEGDLRTKKQHVCNAISTAA